MSSVEARKDIDRAARVVLIVTPRQRSHFLGTLGVARQLRKRGYRVVYLSAWPEAIRDAEEQGYSAKIVPHLRSYQVPWGAQRRRRVGQSWLNWLCSLPVLWKNGRHEVAFLLKSVPEIKAVTAAIASEFSPRLVMFDAFLLPYALPFIALRIPVASLSSKPPLVFSTRSPPYTSGRLPDASVWSRLVVALCWLRSLSILWMWWFIERLLTGYTPNQFYRKLAARVDSAKSISIRSQYIWLYTCFRSYPEFVMTAPSFALFPGSYPRNQQFLVGPCVDLDRAEPEIPSWINTRGDRPLIYCSLSTIPHEDALEQRAKLLQRLVTAVTDRQEWDLVISTGAAGINSECLPPNVKTYTELPQLKILARASLFVTHAGAKGIKEAIFFGVPMLLYPERSDQFGNAARVEYRGLGITGDSRRDTKKQLLAKLDRLMQEPSFKLNAERWRRVFQECNESNRAVRTIEGSMANS